MKKILLLTLFLTCSTASFANDAKNQWQNTVLKDETIKQIQYAQFNYKKCVAREMQKQGHTKIENRILTSDIIKRCEPVLSNMRQTYIKADVPLVIADRHLKQMRIKMTRRLLKELMFQEAARAAGSQ